jgi:hypothetical protein
MQSTACTRSRRALLAAALALTLAAGRAEAQWSSTTYQPSQPVVQTARLIVHDNGLGIQAFSPSAGKWTTVSPPGSTLRSQSDGVLVTEEADGLLRAYSARLNASALQAVTPGALGAFVFTKGETALVIDNAPTGIAVLRAYSAVLNAWTSVVPPMAYTSGSVGERVAAVVVGTGYYGYSALRGQWAHVSGAGPAQFATSQGNLITAELTDFSGPFTRRMAAFSAITGNWSVAPIDISIGGGLQNWGTNVYVYLSGGPGAWRFVGYSAHTGQWTPSSMLHGTLSVEPRVGENLIVVRDIDAAHRFEAFGARNTAWAALTGPNLDFAPPFGGVNSDYALVANSATGEVHAISALRPSPWNTLSPGAGAVGDTTARHLGVVARSSPAPTYWAYLPGLDAWSAPLNVNLGSVLTLGDSVANVYAKNVDATHNRCYGLGARPGPWVAGPLVDQASGTISVAAGSLVLNYADSGPDKGKSPIFDGRSNTWGATFTSSLPVVLGSAAGSQALLWLGGQVPSAYSARRGSWSSPSGSAGLTTLGPALGKESFWYADAANKLWAFSALDDGQVWFDWPDGSDFTVPGPTSGAVPTVGYSMRGKPGVDLAFCYASFGFVNGLAVAGVGGLLYLDPLTIVPVGSFGLVDADGMLEKQIPLAGALPSPVTVWLQPVLIDTVLLQARFGGRAEQAVLY